MKNLIIFRTYNFYLFFFFLFILSATVFGQSIRTEEDVQQIAEEFLLKEQTNPPNVLTKGEEPLVAMNKAIGLNLGKIQSITDEDETIYAFIQELEPQGFIIISAENDIKPILGFSFDAKFPFSQNLENPLIKLIKTDIKNRKKAISMGGKIMPSVSLSTPDSQWGPILQTHWYQTGNFNSLTPDIPGYNFKSVVGCVATAFSQIINYWELRGYKLDVLSFDESDGYLSKGTNPYIAIDSDASSYNFPNFNQVNDYFQQYSYGSTYESYLSFAAGIAVRTQYGSESSANTSTVARALRDKFQFGSAAKDDWPFVWSRKRDVIIENIQKGLPAQAAIAYRESLLSKRINGHSVVLDGYRSNTGEFHVNMGWSNSTLNFWYELPIIETPHYDFNLITKLVYDILPFQGWNQIGADQQNSYRAIYPVPFDQPERKWSVSVPSGLGLSRYSHLIVGTGGRIYTSLNPSLLGANYHPYLAIYDKYGTREKLIEVTESNVAIHYLNQNSMGEIFFGSDYQETDINESRVFRIDPRTDDISIIFRHNSPDAGILEQPLKIDSDDYLYFVVEPRFVANYAKFYSITKSGEIRWSHSFPSFAWFPFTISAVDEDRDRVYLTYYNSNTEKSHLIAFRRSNGSVVYDIEIPTSTHTASQMARVPVVTENGNIYIGVYTSLFAYSSNGTKLWEKSFYPAFTNQTPPALGPDGTIYVNFGKLIDGNWRPGFIRALNPSNGNTRWEMSLPLSSSDRMGETYASSNSMVIYSYIKDEQNRLGALKDNGSSYEHRWDMEGGGTVAFGPGSTIYSILGGRNQPIYAFTDKGERGDPEGMGMEFADNRPPIAPSNRTPADGYENQDTTSVQLSWTASDPDGHSLKYDVYVVSLIEGEEAAFVPVATQLTENSYTLSDLPSGTKFLWSVVATDGQAMTEGPVWSFSTIGDPTSITIQSDNLPDNYELAQNYPNPFNSSTLIRFGIPQNSKVVLNVYNILGQKIVTLVDEVLPAGYHEVHWDANISSGVYFYRLEALSENDPSMIFLDVKKMTLLR